MGEAWERQTKTGLTLIALVPPSRSTPGFYHFLQMPEVAILSELCQQWRAHVIHSAPEGNPMKTHTLGTMFPNQASLETAQVQIPASRKSRLHLSHLCPSLLSFTKMGEGSSRPLCVMFPLHYLSIRQVPLFAITWHSTAQPGELLFQRLHRAKACKSLPLARSKLMVTLASTNCPEETPSAFSSLKENHRWAHQVSQRPRDSDSLRVLRAFFCCQQYWVVSQLLQHGIMKWKEGGGLYWGRGGREEKQGGKRRNFRGKEFVQQRLEISATISIV